MIGLIGIVCVFGMVFGGYLWSGGKFGIILKALPYEMTMIIGAAVGAFLISNRQGGHQAHDQRSGKGVQGPALETPRLTGTFCAFCSN